MSSNAEQERILLEHRLKSGIALPNGHKFQAEGSRCYLNNIQVHLDNLQARMLGYVLTHEGYASVVELLAVFRDEFEMKYNDSNYPENILYEKVQDMFQKINIRLDGTDSLKYEVTESPNLNMAYGAVILKNPGFIRDGIRYWNGMRLDLAGRTMTYQVDGDIRTATFAPNEFDALCYMMINNVEPVHFHEFESLFHPAVQGYGDFDIREIMRPLINRIKGRIPDLDLIKSARGVGYKIPHEGILYNSF